jgi:hypothetical protein
MLIYYFSYPFSARFTLLEEAVFLATRRARLAFFFSSSAIAALLSNSLFERVVERLLKS